MPFKKGHTIGIKHGHAKRGQWSKTFSAWANMLQRCYNPFNNNFPKYGARGIKVTHRWHTFSNFLQDMGNPPKGKTLDRINNNGNYCKSNCKWSTPADQSWNQRARGKVPYVGVYKHWSGKYVAGICRFGVRYHIGYFKTAKEASKAYEKFKQDLKQKEN